MTSICIFYTATKRNNHLQPNFKAHSKKKGLHFNNMYKYMSKKFNKKLIQKKVCQNYMIYKPQCKLINNKYIKVNMYVLHVCVHINLDPRNKK